MLILSSSDLECLAKQLLPFREITVNYGEPTLNASDFAQQLGLASCGELFCFTKTINRLIEPL